MSRVSCAHAAARRMLTSTAAASNVAASVAARLSALRVACSSEGTTAENCTSSCTW